MWNRSSSQYACNVCAPTSIPSAPGSAEGDPSATQEALGPMSSSLMCKTRAVLSDLKKHFRDSRAHLTEHLQAEPRPDLTGKQAAVFLNPIVKFTSHQSNLM